MEKIWENRKEFIYKFLNHKSDVCTKKRNTASTYAEYFSNILASLLIDKDIIAIQYIL